MTTTACATDQSESTSAAHEAQLAQLPERVAAMREHILSAAEEQDLNKLRAAIERNEVMPLFGAPGKRPRRFSEAIDFLKAQSFDGQGMELFRLLATILNAPYVRQKRQPVDMYVWPAQALDPELLMATPAAEVYRFVAFSDLDKLDGNGRPLMNRVEIGADGTWHFFAVN